MLTVRDRAVVEWIGRLGAVGVGEVMAHFELGRTVAYRRLAACEHAGVLSAVRLLHGSPALWIATGEGLRWTGLDEFSVCRVSPGSAAHWQACARMAVWLERREPCFVVRGERELRVAERRAGRLLASVAVGGALPDGRARLHRPDLLLVPRAAGLPVAVEVELSVKGARRLEAIVRGWARCREVAGVRYYAAPAAERALRRAIAATLADEFVQVCPLPAGVYQQPAGGTDARSAGFAA